MGKRLSLSGLLIVGGVAALTTAIGAEKADQLVAGLNSGGWAITGAGLVATSVGLAAASSASESFGNKYRGFLSRYGLKP